MDLHSTFRSGCLPALLLAIALAPQTVSAAPEQIDSTVELRLRRMADLDLESADADDSGTEREDDYHFRLLTGLRAGWDDDIAANLKIQSQGLWENRNEGDQLETGIAEAFINARSIGFLPLSARLGRLRLQSGRGLLLSDDENDWGFDAADAVCDGFPFTYRLLGGRTSRLSPETDIEWLGMGILKYEPRTPFLRALSLYAGAVDSYSSNRFYPLGVRIEAALNPEMNIWSEFAWESGRNPQGDQLAAWIADAGSEYIFRRKAFNPAVSLRATVASGAGGDDRRDFEPLMDRGIGGVVLRPRLSNIQILQMNASFRPIDRIGVDYSIYSYRRYRSDAGVVGRGGWVYEGITVPADGTSRDLGLEMDLGLDYRVDEHLSLRATAGYFKFGSAYNRVAEEYLLEGWLEMIWRY